MRSARARLPRSPGGRAAFFDVGGPWCSKHAAARVRMRSLGRHGGARCAPSLLQGCNARARGSLRRHIRGKSVERARREARATAGTHSGRGRPPARQCVEGQQEARGARQRVALCFGSRGGRARPVPIEELEPGARVPRHFLELCEWFRDCSQASGASQRVQRASAPRPSIGLRCGWPCTAWPAARPQPGSCFAEIRSMRACLVARVHSLASAVRTRSGVA